jgi:4-aminobutyrate aminotransferase-like enzyme/Ser/Thr protein kinase RdoA (MazF antagonist)
MSVLEATPPSFSADDVARIAAERFGLEGTVRDLGSERDQTFLLDDGVVKISNLGEDPSVLDLETQAILHVSRVDPDLPVALPRPVRNGDAYWTTAEGHYVRLFERMRGHFGGPELGDDAVREFAATHARLNLALRGFFHPAAGRELLWDVANAPKLRSLLGSIGDATRRRLVEDALDRFEARVQPRWALLRAHVVHGDFNLDNIFLDELDRVAGIVDFGDVVHTAEVADFAIALASVLRGRPDDDAFRIARIAIDGYAGVLPFEPAELEILGDLVAARLAAIVSISAWRVQRYPENAEYIQAWDEDSWRLLEHFSRVGLDKVAVELGAEPPLVSTSQLVRSRRRRLGAALTDLTYAEPVHVLRGEGVWLHDADGRRLLDAYNNVPVVGHCHPRVVEAVVRQTRKLNTHSRYLYEPLIELAERLVATMPPDSGLDTVMLVNSGSEATELAWRLATAATGKRGAIVTEHAYHGVTALASDLSPEEWPEGYRARATELVSPTQLVEDAARAVEALDAAGLGLAATILDSALTSDGLQTPSIDALAAFVEQTHEAGGLFVADEVQAGHGRSGEQLWSFAARGITPDVVTMGKPMGNGYPVAAVVSRSEIFDRLAADTKVFSTFGGNPVAACAAIAVLDVIRDEQLIEHTARVGASLRAGLDELGVGDVRGRGLLVGLELASAAEAERVVNGLREDGILIGRTGRGENVLKIRPPLVFQEAHAEMLVSALRRCIGDATD